MIMCFIGTRLSGEQVMKSLCHVKFGITVGHARRWLAGILAILCIWIVGPAGAAAPGAGEIDRLIRQLGSNRYKVRQAADRRLRNLGEPALYALREAQTTSTDPEIRLRAGQLVQALAHPLGIGGRLLFLEGGTASMVFSPDARWLVTAGAAGIARLWDLKAADPSARFVDLRGHAGAIRNHELAVSPNGRWLVTGAADRTARLWDLQKAGPKTTSRVLPGYFSPRGNRLPLERSLVIGSNSLWLVLQGPDQAARMWDLRAADPSARCVVFDKVAPPKGNLGSLVTSPNGRWLALLDADHRTVRVIDLEAADPQAGTVVVRSRKGNILRVWAITANGRWLGVVQGTKEDDHAELWDLRARDPSAKSIPLPDFG
jgi:WD40 repeat protein